MGLWLAENEGAKLWMAVLNELRNRGVQDILIASVDGLPEFAEAIHAVFVDTEVQRCIIHQLRACARYVSYKDVKAFSTDLKPVYKASTEETAAAALDEFDKKWGAKYPLAVKSWRANWTNCP